MKGVHTGARVFAAMRSECGTAAWLGGAADWLRLAAAPTFAAMALLTAASGGSDALCMPTEDASPFSGMVFMYLLMSVFHSAPWLTLIASRRAAAPEFRPKAPQEIR